MSKQTALERSEEWWREHPGHVHKFVYSPDTLNKHCACGAWVHHLDNRIHEVYEAEQTEKGK